jgi:hypothetical protein
MRSIYRLQLVTVLPLNDVYSAVDVGVTFKRIIAMSQVLHHDTINMNYI